MNKKKLCELTTSVIERVSELEKESKKYYEGMRYGIELFEKEVWGFLSKSEAQEIPTMSMDEVRELIDSAPPLKIKV